MEHEIKQFHLKDFTIADAGQVKAVFATLGVVDHDGDIILPGSIVNGQTVRMSAYNHASWGGALPVGKGTIVEIGNELVFNGQFFMDTEGGAETYKTVKGLGDLGEWSFGFDVLDKAVSVDQTSQQEVRLLKKLNVYEVSPVLLGAGIGTRTTDIKARGHEEKGAIPSHSTDTTDEAWSGPDNEKNVLKDQSFDYYKTIYAYVDDGADRALKTSYRFIHHMVSGAGKGGAANVRACRAGIGILNGARGGTTIPSSAKQGVYDHLARHLRDAGLEAPELASKDDEGLRLKDHADMVLDDAKDFVARAQSIADLRQEKGKEPASEKNRDNLKAIASELTKAAGELTRLAESAPEVEAKKANAEAAALFARLETNEIMGGL